MLNEITNYAVHCPTRELAVKVLNIAHRRGFCWGSGRSYLEDEDHWTQCGEYTCYIIEYGMTTNLRDAKRADRQIIHATAYLYHNGDSRLFLDPLITTNFDVDISSLPDIASKKFLFKLGDIVTNKRYPYQQLIVVTSDFDHTYDGQRRFTGTCIRDSTLEIAVGINSSNYVYDDYELVEGFEISLKLTKHA